MGFEGKLNGMLRFASSSQRPELNQVIEAQTHHAVFLLYEEHPADGSIMGSQLCHFICLHFHHCDVPGG